eukprot:scaffold81762_cov46-Attheya_sp.AAC.4
MDVGSSIRCLREVGSTDGECFILACRAMVATLGDGEDEKMATIVWEDLTPRPLASPILTGWDLPGKDFLITPLSMKWQTETSNRIVEEDIVPMKDLTALLPFEKAKQEEVRSSPAEYKQWGDSLFQLKDFSVACSYYEASLEAMACKQLQLGGSLVVKSSDGRPLLAELDYIDSSTAALDVMICADSSECTVSRKDVLMCLMESDDDRLNERVLLNLSRCLLQLANMEDASANMRASEAYRKSAVLGCTLAICCALHYKSSNEDDSSSKVTEEKARILRATSYIALRKYPHASADLRNILMKLNPNSKQALKLSRELEHQQAQAKLSSRKLAKEMCKWVQHATGENEVSDYDDPRNESPAQLYDSVPNSAPNSQISSLTSPSTIVTFSAGSRIWLILSILVIATALILGQVM